jgi:CBS domain-containing protein
VKIEPLDYGQGSWGQQLQTDGWFEEVCMKAKDVMTPAVITVGLETSIQDIAAIMSDKRISGVLVLSGNDEILGIVSESDLLHRTELGTERRYKWWFRLFGDSNALARDYAKAHGLKARDVMSRHVISVRDEAELRDIADILDNHRIKRVPVMQNGRLVGIVTRGDLVRALRLVQKPHPTGAIENANLHKALRERMRTQSWLNKNYINLAVHDGIVELWGYVDSEDEHSALRALIEETAGVRNLEDNVMVGSPVRVGV